MNALEKELLAAKARIQNQHESIRHLDAANKRLHAEVAAAEARVRELEAHIRGPLAEQAAGQQRRIQEMRAALEPTVNALDMYAHWLARGGDQQGALRLREIRDAARAALEEKPHE